MGDEIKYALRWKNDNTFYAGKSTADTCAWRGFDQAVLFDTASDALDFVIGTEKWRGNVELVRVRLVSVPQRVCDGRA